MIICCRVISQLHNCLFLDARSSVNLMISEAFLRFFVEAIGHYGQYIITESDGTRAFQKDKFVKGWPACIYTCTISSIDI